MALARTVRAEHAEEHLRVEGGHQAGQFERFAGDGPHGRPHVPQTRRHFLRLGLQRRRSGLLELAQLWSVTRDSATPSRGSCWRYEIRILCKEGSDTKPGTLVTQDALAELIAAMR